MLRNTKKLGKVFPKALKILRPNSIHWPNEIGSANEMRELLGAQGHQHLEDLMQLALTKKRALAKAAFFLANVGLPDHAIKAYEACLQMKASDGLVHQYLQTLMYSSPEKYNHLYLYQAHLKWGKRLQSPFKYSTYPNELSTNRKLKIGYTCHFITNSTSSTLLLPILKAHDKTNVEIYMYSDQHPKQIRNAIRESVTGWRDTYGWDDGKFCQQVRADQIDILLELNGHCATNRYRALTRKPAPIQINFYNYSNTCGVPGIDYILLGNELNLDYLQPFYSEKIYYKKGLNIANPVSDQFPKVGPLPRLKNGYITFGSFGQAHKVSRQQIQLWCKVLQQVPNSRFYMKANVFSCPIKRSVFANHFAAGGIGSDRAILEGPSDYQTLLHCYENVDITLDTYPFGGGTTPIESIIQGVPVITLIGERFCSLHGYYNLHNLGHDDWICRSENEFIQTAVQLANNVKQLAHYRETLREVFMTSPRSDMGKFVMELEEAYKAMWEIYCRDNTSAR